MTLAEGAERLHHLTKELLRRYQFRDRNQVCCYGISVSQSHILDILAEEGDLTMQQLARRMFKSVSTMTRVAGQLVRKGYIKRRQDPEDRRIVHVSIMPHWKSHHRRHSAGPDRDAEGNPAERAGGGVDRRFQGRGCTLPRCAPVAGDLVQAVICYSEILV